MSFYDTADEQKYDRQPIEASAFHFFNVPQRGEKLKQLFLGSSYCCFETTELYLRFVQRRGLFLGGHKKLWELPGIYGKSRQSEI